MAETKWYPRIKQKYFEQEEASKAKIVKVDEAKDKLHFCDVCLMLIDREIDMTVSRHEFAIA
jgi:hypothetical protein